MLGNIEFCDLREENLDEVFAIERENILEAWSMENLHSLIGDEKARARVGIYDGKVICYYSYYAIAGEGFINNLAVDKNFQHMGVGKKMMADMISCAKKDLLDSLTLEVEEDNQAAIALYKSTGFVEEGRRRAFYKNKKDAIIMWLRDICR